MGACPVVAFVSTGDPLFTLGYSRLVYERLVAPQKRLIELPAEAYPPTPREGREVRNAHGMPRLQ